MMSALAAKARGGPARSPVQRAPVTTSTVGAVAAPARSPGPFYSAGPAFGLGANVQRQAALDKTGRDNSAIGTNRSPSHSSARADIQCAINPSGPTMPAAPERRPVQAKLAVGAPGDAFEREADDASQQVVAGKPVQRISRLSAEEQPREATTGAVPVQRQCAACAEEQAKGGIQRKCASCAQAETEQIRRESGPSSMGAAPAGQSASPAGGDGGLDTARAEREMTRAGSGSPLSPLTRADMEQHFGADFSGVRVHRGEPASEANRALNARAFTHGSDIFLGREASPDDRGLMAHELTHVVQQSPATPGAVQRQPAPPQKDAPTPAAPAPAVDHVAELRTALGGLRKVDAFAAIKAMTRSEGERVLADPSMRVLAVWTLETREMVEALRLLPGSLVPKIEWLRTAGGNLDDAKAVIDAAPKAERPGLYARDDLRDWFISIIGGSYGEIYMKDLVVLHLGGTLRQQLGWIKAEGGTNFRLLIDVLRTAPADQRAALLGDFEMQTFFKENVKDYEMKWVVDTLGGPLSAQIEWLKAKGTDEAPEAAKKLPSLSERDVQLLDRLEGQGELLTLYEKYEQADQAVRNHTENKRFPIGPSLQDLVARRAEALAALDAALAAQFPEISQSIGIFEPGALRLGAFLDELRRFEALFVGFGLQTAFTMLADNARIAMKERGRYANSGEADALLHLLSYKLYGSKRARVAIQFSWSGGADLSPYFTADELQAFPILTHPDFYDDNLWDIITRFNPGDSTTLRRDVEAIASHVRGVADHVLDNIKKTHESVSGDTDKLWQLEGVITQAKQGLGIVKGSVFDRLIQRKLDQIKRDETFGAIALAALAIVLGLLSGGTGAVAVLAAAGTLAISAAGAVQSYRRYEFTSAAHGASIDPAQALTQVNPNALWLAVDVISVFLDSQGFVSAINRLAEPAMAMVTAGRATETTRAALEKRAREVAADLKVGTDIVSGEAREALIAGVLGSAERRAAEVSTLTADRATTIEVRDTLRAMGKEGQALANEDAAVAGLLSLSRETRETVLRGFRQEPELLGRLAVFAGPAEGRAVGLNRLRNSLGDSAFENVMRDLILRRDLGRANALARAVEEDALSAEELGRLSVAGRNTDPAARAQAIADELDRSLTEATGLAAPGSQAERTALDRTRRLDSTKLKEIDDPAAQLADEMAYVQRQSPLPVEDPEYVAEVTLPNGHKWRQNRAGRWCRFSDELHCPTKEQLEEIHELIREGSMQVSSREGWHPEAEEMPGRRGPRVEPHERRLAHIAEQAKKREIGRMFANAIGADRLQHVRTSITERTVAGRSQVRAVTPGWTEASIEFEHQFRLTRTGLVFQPDGLWPGNGGGFWFVDHKAQLGISARIHNPTKIMETIDKYYRVQLELGEWGCRGLILSVDSEERLTEIFRILAEELPKRYGANAQNVRNVIWPRIMP
jgi:hypothetical protein